MTAVNLFQMAGTNTYKQMMVFRSRNEVSKIEFCFLKCVVHLMAAYNYAIITNTKYCLLKIGRDVSFLKNDENISCEQCKVNIMNSVEFL